MTAPVLRLIPGTRPRVGDTIRIAENGPSGWQMRKAEILFIDEPSSCPVTVRVESMNSQRRRFAVLWDLRWDEIESIEP
jgi:hypothetical protein